MVCWSVELVVFFLLLTIKSYRLRIFIVSESFISVSFIYVWDLRLQNEMF